MKLVSFIICLSILYLLIYIACLTLSLVSLLMGYFSADEFLHLLSLIGSFLSVFFSILYNFFEKIQLLPSNDLDAGVKFNTLFVIYTFIIIFMMGLSLFFGILLDAFNIGFSKAYHFDIYFLVVQSSFGLYSGNLINIIFKHTEKLNNV